MKIRDGMTVPRLKYQMDILDHYLEPIYAVTRSSKFSIRTLAQFLDDVWKGK